MTARRPEPESHPIHNIYTNMKSDTKMRRHGWKGAPPLAPDAETPGPVVSAGAPVVFDVVSLTMLEVDVESTDVLGSATPVVVEETTELDIDVCIAVLEDCPTVELAEPIALTIPVSVEAAEIKESKTVSAMTVSTASLPMPVFGDGASVGIVAMGIKRLIWSAPYVLPSSQPSIVFVLVLPPSGEQKDVDMAETGVIISGISVG